MFMQQHDNNNNENVCWLVPQEPMCNPSRYKSQFAAKVRWDCWVEKKGCCKTIGPPPKVCVNCPEQFLRKHSRQVPVFFTQEELRASVNKERLKKYEYKELPPPKKRFPPLNTGISRSIRPPEDDECPFPRPPSRLGLFRSPFETPYEKRYLINKQKDCACDSKLWEDLVKATECAGVMAAQMEKRRRNRNGNEGPQKDFIRSNAIQVIRMPARRLRRCYVDQCGVHLIDMSDAPYVLRPGFGKVPPYLHKRKMELYQKDLEAKRRMEMTPYISGTEEEAIQMVDEAEKEMVIKGLKDYWAHLLHQYNSLPLNDTGSERHRELKHSLEERMKEVEQDLKLLTSSSTLFVGDVTESRYL